MLAGGAAYTSALVARQQDAPSGASRYNVTWLISQAGVELARLQASVGGAAIRGAEAAVDEVQLRFDVLANRVGLLQTGEAREFIHADPELAAIATQLEEALARALPLIEELEADGAVPQLYSLLAPLNARLARLASAANIRGGDQVAEFQAGLDNLYQLLRAMLAGMGVCGAGLIGWQWRQNGALRRAHAQAAAMSADLRRAGERFDAALSNMSQGLCMADAEQRILVCNRRFAEMFGIASGEVAVGSSIVELFRSAERSGRLPSQLVTEIEAEQRKLALRPQTHAFLREGPDGTVVSVSHKPMPDGGWVATYDDVTERHRSQERLAHMARHDALTGLPNRVQLREHMEGVLAHVRRGAKAAVLCLDLDGFKGVNDTLGHPVGDELLRQVARRLKENARETDLVVRLGGDEFAVVQVNAAQPEGAALLAGRLVEAMRAPFDLQGQRAEIGTSIGVVLADAEATTPDELLRSADVALYSAKADGRGTFRFFEPAMDVNLRARRELEGDLKRALTEEQFEVYYQPLLEADTGALTGFEALLRWRHPERGMVSPEDFVPLAEEIGLIRPIGAWVLRKACAAAAGWPGHVRVAVNLSPMQFVKGDLLGEVCQALATSGLAPNRLELEITESVLLHDNDATLSLLHRLRALGVRIAMDDFGTGYSSLSYLRSFPFDKIKVDRSFVSNLINETGSLEIVRAVVGLGKALGMCVLAEGVETREQLSILRAEGCDELQGYLFSKPRPWQDVAGIIAAHPAPTTAPVLAISDTAQDKAAA